MDELSEVLRLVRVSRAVFFTAEFSAPWAIESPNPALLASLVLREAQRLALFHILTDGECHIACAGRQVVLETGDVAVFPGADTHTMRSRGAGGATSLAAVMSAAAEGEMLHLSLGGGGRASRLLCGYLQYDERFGPLVGALPTMLVLRSRDDYAAIDALGNHGLRETIVPRGPSSWLSTTLKFTIHEAQANRPGNAAVLGRLTELMFVEILREYLQHVPFERRGWLAGLLDPTVGPALRLLHGQPMRDWTVDELARAVATSRSALAQRFRALVGETPMRHLANWRMQLATQLLRQRGCSVQHVATRVGYASEAAFSRAFKRVTGARPGAWRKSALGASVLLQAAWSSLG